MSIKGLAYHQSCGKRSISEEQKGFVTEEVTILELAQKVIELSGSNSQITFISYDEAYGLGFEDMRRRIPDISKINKAIGWAPQLSLDDSLKHLLAYYIRS